MDQRFKECRADQSRIKKPDIYIDAVRYIIPIGFMFTQLEVPYQFVAPRACFDPSFRHITKPID